MKRIFVDHIERIKRRPIVSKGIDQAKVIYDDFIRCDLFKHASAMAYVTLLGLVPSLAVTFSLIALFQPFWGSDLDIFIRVKNFIFTNLATGTGETVINYLESYINNLDIKKIGLSGFAGILVSLVLLLRQIEIALNKIWLIKKTRNWFTRFAYFWTFITLGSFLIGVTLGVVSEFNLKNFIPFLRDQSYHSGLISTLLPISVIFASFFMLYKIVPNCFVKASSAFLGSVAATLLFWIASWGYKSYVVLFNGYHKIYGALAAIPLFLVWLYIVWLLILVGAFISWKYQEYSTQRSDS